MIGKVRRTILRDGLLVPGDHALVGLSGGPDSVALLLVLHRLAPKLGIRLTVAHLNHGLRGRRGREDAKFVEDLATRMGIPFVTGRTDVRQMAQRHGISIEMAARRARYGFFARTARRVSANVIVTAHTADDQAETLLLNLCRGTGLRGLGGIKPCSLLHNLRLVRPMLEVHREEVLAFLRRKGVTWCTDETNQDLSIPRNRVRHEILPALEAGLSPAVRAVLARTAAVIREEDEWLEDYCRRIMLDVVEREHDRMQLLLSRLPALARAVRRRVLRCWLVAAGLPQELISFDLIGRLELLVGKTAGTEQIEIAGRWEVVRKYDRLFLTRRRKQAAIQPFCISIAIPGVTVLDHPGLRVTVSVGPGLFKDVAGLVGRLPARASLRLSALRGRKLRMRSWKPGDRMRPLGLSGSKKLQDIFVDAKVPREERKQIPIFECGGKIVWLPGYRIAEGWEVRNPEAQAVQIAVERL